MKNKITLLAVLAASATAAYANSDPATLFLWDNSATGNDKTVADESASDTLKGIPGGVGFSGGVGVFSLQVDTGSTKPLLGSAAAPSMDLNFDEIAATGVGTLNIAFFDDNFTPALLTAAFAHIGGTLPANASVTYKTYVGIGNTTPTFDANGQLILTGFSQLTTQSFTGAGTSTGNNFGGDTTGSAISGGSSDYSLLQVITITTTASVAGFSGDSNLHTAPDGGATLMLLGSGLTALALVRRSFKMGKA